VRQFLITSINQKRFAMQCSCHPSPAPPPPSLGAILPAPRNGSRAGPTRTRLWTVVLAARVPQSTTSVHLVTLQSTPDPERLPRPRPHPPCAHAHGWPHESCGTPPPGRTHPSSQGFSVQGSGIRVQGSGVTVLLFGWPGWPGYGPPCLISPACTPNSPARHRHSKAHAPSDPPRPGPCPCRRAPWCSRACPRSGPWPPTMGRPVLWSSTTSC
jgi:hypothetical protein